MNLPPDVLARLTRHSAPAGACLIWTGAVRMNGYGVIGWWEDGRARTFQAHRVAFAATFGPIPDGLHIHHVCQNRLCVNPSHLAAIRQAEHNALHTRVFCRRGLHLLSEHGRPNGSNARTCRACSRERARLRREQAA